MPSLVYLLLRLAQSCKSCWLCLQFFHPPFLNHFRNCFQVFVLHDILLPDFYHRYEAVFKKKRFDHIWNLSHPSLFYADKWPTPVLQYQELKNLTWHQTEVTGVWLSVSSPTCLAELFYKDKLLQAEHRNLWVSKFRVLFAVWSPGQSSHSQTWVKVLSQAPPYLSHGPVKVSEIQPIVTLVLS